MRAAETCLHAGATATHVAVTHTPLASGLEALMTAEPITSITVTDSVGIAFPARRPPSGSGKLIILSIAPLFGQALARMVNGRPVAPLLESWPVSPEP